MKLATTTGDFSKFTNHGLEAIKYIHEAGFEFLDYSFDVDFQRGTGVFDKNSKNSVEMILKEAEKYKMRFVQAHSPMGSPITKDENYEEFISGTKKCIEVCSKLGIKNLVVHSGYEKGLSKEETFERNKEFYLDILKDAEKYDVNILTENFNKICVDGYYWIDNVYDMKELIEYIDHPLLGACFDTGHANLQKESQKEQIEALEKHLKAIHVHDNMGDGDTHNALWYGTLDIDSLMEGLLSIGYDGYFTFELGNHYVCYKRNEMSGKLATPPLEIKIETEKLIYKMGKYILETYNLFDK